MFSDQIDGSTTLRGEIEEIYTQRAHGRYGLENISRAQHALQSAMLAEARGEAPALVLAALLHDVGHMIHKLGVNPAGEGIDDRHEIIGAKWLAKRLPVGVSEPVRLHVEAKRYLCAIDPTYFDRLAPDSVLSLKLQGGLMNAEEAAAFIAKPFAEDAVRLRMLVETRIAPVIAAVTGEIFIPFKDKENEKHPGGGAFGAHQDFAAHQTFGPRYNVTAMISVDAATLKNGCLEFAANWADFKNQASAVAETVINGQALLPYHKGGSKNGDILDEIVEALDWQPIETSPSDLVLFDSFVPHRSATNTSAASRRAMFLTFNAVREGDWYARYYADKRANFDDPKFHVLTPTAHAG